MIKNIINYFKKKKNNKKRRKVYLIINIEDIKTKKYKIYNK